MTDWSRIGSLRQKMTQLQALACLQMIGDNRPSEVAVHDCGLARIVICGHEIHIDESGNAVSEPAAQKRKRLHEVNKPKRGRPRKETAQ